MLTVADVEQMVAAIAAKARDPEDAHALEDDLWKRALEVIAEGHPDPARIARAALKTSELEFERWCA